MTQNQARLAWPNVYPRTLWQAELEGKLFSVAVGNRVYYRYDQLVALFGEPTTPIRLLYLHRAA